MKPSEVSKVLKAIGFFTDCDNDNTYILVGLHSLDFEELGFLYYHLEFTALIGSEYLVINSQFVSNGLNPTKLYCHAMNQIPTLRINFKNGYLAIESELSAFLVERIIKISLAYQASISTR
jgi:hypothetical protein